MKKRVILSVIISTIIIGAFVTLCYFTYTIDSWNEKIFWWTWFGIVWLTDTIVGLIIFYGKNRAEDTKAFWLFIMILIPITGAAIALIFCYKNKLEYEQPDNDHSKLLRAIFAAKKTIKIYSNSFFASNETYKALNFARWKNVDIEIIISKIQSKRKRNYIIHNLKKNLENKVKLYFTDKQITQSFIIVDNEKGYITEKNFNFKNIFSQNNLKSNIDINNLLSIWNEDHIESQLCDVFNYKIGPFAKFEIKLTKIFYLFY